MMTDSLQCVMEIIDKNQDKISQGDYLILCNQLKDIYNIIDQKWDPKPSDDNILYVLLKMGVQEATRYFVFCVTFLLLLFLLLLSFFVISTLFAILFANLCMFLEEYITPK